MQHVFMYSLSVLRYFQQSVWVKLLVRAVERSSKNQAFQAILSQSLEVAPRVPCALSAHLRKVGTKTLREDLVFAFRWHSWRQCA